MAGTCKSIACLEGETGYVGDTVIIMERCNTGDKNYTG